MQQLYSVVALLAILSLLLAPVSVTAQQTGNRGANTAPTPGQVHKVSTYIGSSVVNPQGESLGRIEDLVLSPGEGRIKYVALSYGSILGLGGKLFAVPWEALTLQPDGKTFTLDISKEQLDTVSGFDRSNWPQRPDPVLGVVARSSPASPGKKPLPSAPPAVTETSPPSTMSATIEDVDQQAGMITLMTKAGNSVELQAPMELLTGLQIGDVVEVTATGKQLLAIHKHGEPVPPAPGSRQSP